MVSGQFVHLPLYLKKVVSYGFRNPAQSDRGLAKCQVEVKRNTDGVNVFNLNTLTWATSVHSMWSKCPHGMSCNVEDVSGEWRFVLFPQSGGHFDHLILSVPFSLHGFPAPFRRRFPALPCGVIAVYPMQTVFRLSRFVADFAIKNRHTTTETWPSLPGWPWFGFAM